MMNFILLFSVLNMGVSGPQLSYNQLEVSSLEACITLAQQVIASGEDAKRQNRTYIITSPICIDKVTGESVGYKGWERPNAEMPYLPVR